MEEILKQILDGQNKIFDRMDTLEKSQSQMLNRMDTLDKGQSQIIERLESVEDEMRHGENIQMTKAIKIGAEETNANLNGLLLNTASKDSIANLDKKIERIAGDVNFLIRKTTEHEDDIRSLKLAK